ncbi:MAG: transposase [Candidatus Cloacimonetes bacterium]|jgi:REP element-mobilizing transposase RayT|nr:transposase [Candidatus Cloacimonadota bacterium]MDD3562951.1 transposase [Candidatus Cloacimonadota bacterium]MDY0173438.1 transposase [Candidatus Cloacimonadaceae bacterium]
MPEPIQEHRRYLPHYQEPGQIISLTWRLEGELPQQIKATLQEMKLLMEVMKASPEGSISSDLYQQYSDTIARYDAQLGRHKPSGLDLSQPKIARIITTAFHYYDARLYDLHAFCVMPNHVHLLVRPIVQASGGFALLSDIVGRIKSYTAKQIIRTGIQTKTVWRADYFDRFIRGEKDYYWAVEYILDNPLKAKLAQKQRDWPFSFCRDWEKQEI